MNSIDRSSHNWLAMKINNMAFESCRHVIKGRVVDLGCGTAQYRPDILATATQYVGVDWENSLHDRSGVNLFADLSQRLPLRDGCADTVVAFQVMEHLREPGLFLAECHRILRPGGSLFLTVPFMWEVHEAPSDYYRYTRHGLEHLLGKAGFVDRQVRETTGFWQTWVLKFNYHTARSAGALRRMLWMPLWYLGQSLAPLLDRRSGHPEETASYTVTARRAS
ncbi:MAG TPA: class I SAM-dependent methyltransferase [Patescibacteria group bacterium]|jgi:SAM-dependent methyltransferase|nr:class I SAM-dependent methyltransferase [Patescibacteria group bacterium]